MLQIWKVTPIAVHTWTQTQVLSLPSPHSSPYSRHFLSPPVGEGQLMSQVLTLTSPHFPTGKSALHWAAAVNNVEATLALLKNGANKDMQDSKVSPAFGSPSALEQPPQAAESRLGEASGDIHPACSQRSCGIRGQEVPIVDQGRKYMAVAGDLGQAT